MDNHLDKTNRTWWKTGVRLPEIGGTIHTQSAGHPPRAWACWCMHWLVQVVYTCSSNYGNKCGYTSALMCVIKLSVALWWSTMETLAFWVDTKKEPIYSQEWVNQYLFVLITSKCAYTKLVGHCVLALPLATTLHALCANTHNLKMFNLSCQQSFHQSW